MHTIKNASPSWTRSTLAHDQVIQWTKAKVRVYADSVLCLGKMWAHKDAIQLQDVKVKWKNSYKELLGIDGEAIEVEWSFFPGFTSLQILRKIQNDMQKRNI